MSRALPLLLLGVTLALPRPGAASIADEFHGVRSTGMGGAGAGLGTSNDTLYLNPAGMAIGRRYGIELNYAYSPFDSLTHWNASAVDSQSGPVAGGLAYTLDRGDKHGADATVSRIYMGAAYPVTDGLALGVTGRNIRGNFLEGGTRRSVSVYTGDVGLMTRFGQGIGIGFTARNVVKTDVKELTPLTLAGGLALDASPLAVAADLEVNIQDPHHKLDTYRVGAEYLLANAFPVRLGWSLAPATKLEGTPSKENAISAGAGWVSSGGMLAVGAERSLERVKNWRLVATLGIFL